MTHDDDHTSRLSQAKLTILRLVDEIRSDRGWADRDQLLEDAYAHLPPGIAAAELVDELVRDDLLETRADTVGLTEHGYEALHSDTDRRGPPPNSTFGYLTGETDEP